MCGIAGYHGPVRLPKERIEACLNLMARRGPDARGAIHRETSCGRHIHLLHSRLSILDLDQRANQPFVVGGGILTYNGEVYNYLELRSELERLGIQMRGTSDTEVLANLLEYYGVDALEKCEGMFALAWIGSDGNLLLARDRFGEKPLYYGWVGSSNNQVFVFGSELKALRAFPEFTNQISRQALALFMRFSYVPAPFSIYQSIFKLEPGCMLSICGSVQSIPNEPLRPPAVLGGLSIIRWWSLSDVVQCSARNQILDQNEALQTLEYRLAEAVRMQSAADVPLGAFLSGGIDSSAIVAMMQRDSIRPIKTFTVGFEESEFDESPYASAVAKHLGTDHAEIFVTATEAQSVIPNLPVVYDEPFADSSQIPTHLVCKVASQHVTVALSGDAGDELFGGYNRYFWGPRIWSKLSWMPYPTRKLFGDLIQSVPIGGWDALSRPVNALLPSSQCINRAGDKAHKLAVRLSSVRNLDDLYRSLVSEWQDPAQVVMGSGRGEDFLSPNTLLDDALPNQGVDHHQLRMMYRDTLTYLPDDILCKVDRAAMSVSLETRMPFLDHRVVELAWQLPLHMKIREGKGKWALRMLLGKYVPKELIDRPKTGFGVPLGQWLRGPLRPWAENLLSKNLLENESFFYHIPIRKKWNDHLSGRYDHSASLWAVLMFQDWLQNQ